MTRIFARWLALAALAVPLGGCLTISWQDDPTPVASAAAPNGAAAQAQAPAADRVPCDYSSSTWDSTSAARDVYGSPKEYECRKSAMN